LRGGKGCVDGAGIAEGEQSINIIKEDGSVKRWWSEVADV